MSYKIMKPEDVEYIVVHCSATQNNPMLGVKDIDRWHRAKGWWRVGYHYVVRTDGLAEVGRPLENFGAHAQGYNDKSWGICLIGGVDAEGKAEDNYTMQQKETLKGLVRYLKSLAPNAKVLGHRDLSPDLNGDGVITPDEYMKECPCFDVQDWYGENFQPES